MTDDARVRADRLATEPLRIAGPRSGFLSGTMASLRDIVAHRELMGRLARRELKARYKDSTLGFLWTLIRPLTMLLIYYIALGQFLGAARQIPDFAIFVYTGLTAWSLFSEILTAGTGSIVANSGLIKKVYLPREVFPLSVVGSSIVNFSVQLVILTGATVVAGHFPTGERWIYFPAGLALIIVYGTALAMLLSAFNVYLRDVQYLVEVTLLILFWASPIVYSWTLVQDKIDSATLETVYLANPITLAILAFQRTFWVSGDGQPPPGGLGLSLVVALAVGIGFLWLSQRIFSRLQANFAQEL